MRLKLELHLSGSRLGRCVLHLAYILAGGNFNHHLRGIVREF